MLYVMSNSYNPLYNLAAEEYFLKNKTEDYFMLWRSEPAVIIGKHQNLPAEINYPFIRKNNMKVARRLTGGGTVVHDMQNLNFSFIVTGVQGKLIDFKKYIAPIIGFLQSIGVAATIGVKNDIRIGESKISGNAEHVFKNRVLHHGTLLFNSNLKNIDMALSVVPGKYQDKAVQSNRAVVTNISQYLAKPMEIEEFAYGLSKFILKNEPAVNAIHLSNTDEESIQRLMEEKYITDEWIWGYSPRYTFKNVFDYEGQHWQVMLEVEKGNIITAELKINGINNQQISDCFRGLPHRFDVLLKELGKHLNMISLLTLEQVVSGFF